MSKSSQSKKKVESSSNDALKRTLNGEKYFRKNPTKSVHAEIAAALLYGIDPLYGDVMTLIEMLGLPQVQEKAIKAQFSKAYNTRYRSTADHLMGIPSILAQLLEPNCGEPVAMYGPSQNQNIIQQIYKDGGMPNTSIEKPR